MNGPSANCGDRRAPPRRPPSLFRAEFLRLSSVTDASDVTDALADNAAGPQRVQVANQSVDQHAIDDQIKAANYLAAQQAAAKPRFGLRFSKIRPPCGG